MEMKIVYGPKFPTKKRHCLGFSIIDMENDLILLPEEEENAEPAQSCTAIGHGMNSVDPAVSNEGVGVFSVLRELVVVLLDCLADHIATLVSGIEKALSESSNL
ncbi:hypothetical protein MKW98_023117 [Papaver atlanticum]|uniref:Uncharacterized protein n=1 Tax=Papaver atlanticum TaxID=357466 RepID=A0AAD4TBV2_9MAGN|nr:hypothetical protein MKW98_023117 [Papaver atlanticum]